VIITLAEYFGPWFDDESVTDEIIENAESLLERVDALVYAAQADRVILQRNPVTGTHVAGQTLGGYRPPHSTTGAPSSAHKTGQAVDIFDINDRLDNWVTDGILATFGLYREHPDATRHWCHLTTRAPKSGRRSFYP
jgi:hypothetical protein